MSSGTTTLKTGTPQELVTLSAASAGNESVLFANVSGAEVEVFLDSSTEPFRVLGTNYPLNEMLLSDTAATLKVEGRCRTAPLRVRVTPIVP